MSTVQRPRRRLPARVYWVRRIMVLSLALVVVTGIGLGVNALTSSEDSEPLKARTVADKGAASPSSEATSATKPKKKRRANGAASASASQTPELATPEGVCDPEDITVSPFVYRAIAWRHSYILLELKTKRTPACTWRTSPDTVTVRITNSEGEFWTSRQCPLSVPNKELVLRNDVGVKVAVVWSGRRSDTSCTRSTRWAPPGWYRVEAAAFAGEPGQLLFELRKPEDAPAESTTTAPGDTPTDFVADGAGAPEPNR